MDFWVPHMKLDDDLNAEREEGMSAAVIQPSLGDPDDFADISSELIL